MDTPPPVPVYSERKRQPISTKELSAMESGFAAAIVGESAADNPYEEPITTVDQAVEGYPLVSDRMWTCWRNGHIAGCVERKRRREDPLQDAEYLVKMKRRVEIDRAVQTDEQLQAVLNTARTHGYEAGMTGIPVTACQLQGEQAREAWMTAWKAGLRRVRRLAGKPLAGNH